MSDIQKARDVLAKWRQDMGAWAVGGHRAVPAILNTEDKGIAWTTEASVASLIVGTAGNPDLLDAIDGMLAIAAADIAKYGVKPPGLWNDVARIAVAIISADERMSA